MHGKAFRHLFLFDHGFFRLFTQGFCHGRCLTCHFYGWTARRVISCGAYVSAGFAGSYVDPFFFEPSHEVWYFWFCGGVWWEVFGSLFCFLTFKKLKVSSSFNSFDDFLIEYRICQIHVINYNHIKVYYLF